MVQGPRATSCSPRNTRLNAASLKSCRALPWSSALARSRANPAASIRRDMEVARVKIDDELMARDTTCINAIDKDGVMFSATPSGAWLPSGDRRRHRHSAHTARAELPFDPGPSERTRRRQAAPRDAEPDAGHARRQARDDASTPGGDNQDQALLQVFLDVVEFGMNAQTAIEAPRFQTRHLVSSFDNHAMNRGDLLLDERIPGERLF